MQSTPQARTSERTHPARYTWDDFLALPDGDKRELIDGELVATEAPTKLHEYIVARLAYYLNVWAETNGGLVVASGYRIRISDERGVMPDVQYFGPRNPASLNEEEDENARPDLAVEVISPGSRRYDQATKLGWYVEIGVPEYWLIDPDANSLQAFELVEGRYVVAAALEGDAVFKPARSPGLEIPLARLWSIAPLKSASDPASKT
jgi:Uma2 family endonuclease